MFVYVQRYLPMKISFAPISLGMVFKSRITNRKLCQRDSREEEEMNLNEDVV